MYIDNASCAYVFVVFIMMSAVTYYMHSMLGNRGWNYVGRICDWACNKPNPILQISYFAIVFGGYFVFVALGLPYIPRNSWHRYFTVVTMIGCFSTWITCCLSEPGTITHQTRDIWDVYSYDGKLYHANNECRTCHIIKPAVNNCIGAGNYRFFIAFLYQHVWFCGYASYLLSSVLLSYIAEKQLVGGAYIDPKTGKHIPIDWWFIFQYVAYYNGHLWGLWLLSTIMYLILTGFTLFHTYLAITNITTNERSKRKMAIQSLYEIEPEKPIKKQIDPAKLAELTDTSKPTFSLTAALHAGTLPPAPPTCINAPDDEKKENKLSDSLTPPSHPPPPPPPSSRVLTKEEIATETRLIQINPWDRGVIGNLSEVINPPTCNIRTGTSKPATSSAVSDAQSSHNNNTNPNNNSNSNSNGSASIPPNNHNRSTRGGKHKKSKHA